GGLDEVGSGAETGEFEAAVGVGGGVDAQGGRELSLALEGGEDADLAGAFGGGFAGDGDGALHPLRCGEDKVERVAALGEGRRDGAMVAGEQGDDGGFGDVVGGVGGDVGLGDPEAAGTD